MRPTDGLRSDEAMPGTARASVEHNLSVIVNTFLFDMCVPRTKGKVIGFWIVTALFCLQSGFTAYAQLRLPIVAEAFSHLGFPAYFRVELSSAKLLGVVLLLAPVPARLKEWAR
jgi:hypothetical protein